MIEASEKRYGSYNLNSEMIELIKEISSRDNAEQTQIYNVFAIAYDDGYEEGSTGFGRLILTLRSLTLH